MEELNKHTWKVESLRLTSFLKNDFNVSFLENWLRDISGNEPLSINKSINHFHGLAQFKSTILKLDWNFNRIDLFLNSKAPHIENNIGTSTDILVFMNDVFFSFFDLKDCPISKRIATGIILILPIIDYDEGADILQLKLNSVNNIKGTTDFLFRINKPIQSKTIKDLKLNRLMTWSIGYLQYLKIPLIVGQNNPIQQNIQQVQKTEMICRLELDFNTVEKEEILMIAEQQKEITSELIVEAMKVAEKGEFGIEL